MYEKVQNERNIQNMQGKVSYHVQMAKYTSLY